MKSTFTLFFSLIIAFHSWGQVYVTVAGAGANDGSSWANAYSGTQLRGALRAANAGSQFWIAAGTYHPSTVKDSSFYINSGVKVYGGFSGTETLLSARNWNTNETIFSGDIGVVGDSTDNSVHVVVFDLNSIDSTTLLDGLTITRGNAQPDYGGGIYISTQGATARSYPVIKHCKVTHNNAKYGAGGIYAHSYGDLQRDLRLTIDSCIIEYNHCDSATNRAGAGILAISKLISHNTLIMSNSIISHNASNTEGGGLEIRNSSGYSVAFIKKCIFQNDSAEFGGALCIDSYNDFLSPNYVLSVTIDSCLFKENQCSSSGGAIFASLQYPAAPVLTITNTIFESNHAAREAGIFVTNASNKAHVNLINDIFRYNSVFVGNPSAYNITSTYSALDTTNIINCSFAQNRAMTLGNTPGEDGKSYMHIINSTIYVDSLYASTSGPYGLIFNSPYTSAMYPNAWATTTVENSIIYWKGNVGAVAAHNDPNTTISYNNSLIKRSNGSGATWATALGNDMGNNMDVYPEFCDTANFNLNLRCLSPAIDTANNSIITPYLSWNDCNGRNRIYNVKADLGAFEFNAIRPIIAPSVTATGLTIAVQNLSTGQQDSISWTFGDGGTSKYYNTTHTYAAAGTYTVCLHIYSCQGNADSCIQVTVAPATQVPATALSEQENIYVYPNPSSGMMTVAAGKHEFNKYAVINLMGQTLLQDNIPQGSSTINVSALPAGNYYLLLFDNTDRKVVKFEKR